MYKAFLIKYGEIGIKGKNRYLFEYALMDQIKFSLRKVDGQFEVTKEQGRVYVEALSILIPIFVKPAGPRISLYAC